MTFLFILISSLFVSLVSIVGILTIFSKKLQSQNYASGFVSFAAGVMLSAALLDVLPEALELHPEPDLFLAIFGGILVFFFLERFVLWFHHHHGDHGTKPSAVLVLVGDAIHNLLDGLAITAAFLVSPVLGLTTTLAIAAHEIPQEIADFSILTAGGMSRTKALLWNFFSALTSLVGAVLGYFFLRNLEEYIWIFLAFTGGMFLYIASSDLIPELHQDFKKDRRWQQTVPFILGIVILFALTKLIAE